MDKFVEVYEILKDLDYLTKGKYFKMVDKYGINLVGEVIEYLINEDSSYEDKFAYYMSRNLYEKVKHIEVYDYYLSDINDVDIISKDECNELAREINLIIKRINEIFKLINGGVVLDGELKIDGDKYVNSIIDKVNYYVDKYRDSEYILELKDLLNEFIIKRDKIVIGNLRFVIRDVNKKYQNKYLVNELIQVGNIGLMRAVESYDPDKSAASFTTYASFWIKKLYMMVLSKMLYPVSISRDFVNKYYKMNKIQDKFMLEFGRNPTNMELAECMGLSFDEIVLLNTTFMLEEISIYDFVDVGNEETEKIIDLFRCEDISIEDELLFGDNIKNIRKLFKRTKLTSLQRKILEYRYGFIDGNYHTFNEVGEYLSKEGYSNTRQSANESGERGLVRLRKNYSKYCE